MEYTYDYQIEGTKSKINKIVLLSKSPRRKDLLSFLNPVIDSIDIDERMIEEKYFEIYKNDDFIIRAAKTCCEICKAKSDVILEENTLYISADTIIVCNNQIYNKPQNKEEAKKMILSYFGNSHYAISSVCLRMKNYINVFYTISKINFVEYSPQMEYLVDEYIDHKLPYDKAGAYGINEINSNFIKSIEGDYNTILGLSVDEIISRISNKNY